MPRPKKNPDEPRKPSKKWDTNDVVNILMYMKDVISNGRELEKPTAKIFYERMLLSLNMKDVTVSQLSYKVTKMKESYNQAAKWQRNTGAGVDDGSINAHLNKMCEHFDLLEEIYSTKANINPPYIYESASSSSAGVANTYNSRAAFDLSDECAGVANSDNSNDIATLAIDSSAESNADDYIIVYDPADDFGEHSLREHNLNNSDSVTVAQMAVATDSSASTNDFAIDGGDTSSRVDSSSNRTQNLINSDVITVAQVPVATNSNSSRSKSSAIDGVISFSSVDKNSQHRTLSSVPEDTVSRFKRSLSTIPVTKSVKPQKFISNSSAIMSDWQKQRADAIAEKNKILSEKYTRDEKWKENEQKLAEEKFKFEKETRLKEMELKKLEIETGENLRKMEIEKEEKLKIMEMEKEERLAALKMDYEYKLQLQLRNRENL